METFHHYTTIDTLALILKTRKLRFKRLDLVDDKDETFSIVKKNLCTQYFVSCWTLDSRENIPLWKMYSGIDGIRITTDKIPISMNNHISKVNPNKYFESPLLSKENKIFDGNKDFLFFPLEDRFSFYLLEYEDDLEKFKNRKVLCASNSYINIKDLAGLKSNYWAFQKEARMIIQVKPCEPQKDIYEYFEKQQNIDCKLSFIDLDIKDDFIDNIEIVLGPGRSESSKIIVESLINNYTKNGKVKESALYSKIR